MNKYKKIFKGLSSYTKNDSDFFFARDSEVESALEILKKNKILTINGPTSSGKSSFVESGILKRLSQNFSGKSGKSWKFCTFRPGFSPIENLCKSLSVDSTLYLSSKPTTSDFDDYCDIIRKKQGFGLINIYKKSEIFNNSNLLIHIDQIEDLFKYTKIFDSENNKDDDLLIDLIDKSVRNKFCSIYFIISVQDEYLSKLNIYGKFSELLSLSQFNLPGVDSFNLLNKYSYHTKFDIDKNKLNKFSDQINEKPYLITNLQYLLNKLEDNFISSNKNKIDEFDSGTNSLEKIISNDLDAYLQKLSKDNCEIHIRLFRSLINSDVENKIYFQKFKYIKNYIGKDSKTTTEIIINFNSDFGFLFDSISENMTPIMSNNNFIFDDNDVIVLKHQNCLNWKVFKTWEKEESKFYESLLFYESKITQNENLTNSEISEGLKLIKNEFINNYWSDKYAINFTTIIEYIQSQKSLYDDEIRRKNRLLEQSKRKSLILKIGGIVACLAIVVFAIKTHLEKLELRNIKVDRDLVQKTNDTLERNIAALEMKNKSMINLIELEKDTINRIKEQINNQQQLLTAKNKKIINDNEKINFQKNEILVKELKIDSVEEQLLTANRFLNITKEEIRLNNEIKNITRQIRLLKNDEKDKLLSFAKTGIQLYEDFENIQDEKDYLINNHSGELDEINSLIIKTTSNDKNNLRKLANIILSKIYGVEKITQVQEFNLLRDYSRKSNNRLNSIQISDDNKIFTGGESDRLYYSTNKSLELEKIDFDYMSLNSELKSIAIIDDYYLCTSLRNGEIWLIDLEKKSKINIFRPRRTKENSPVSNVIFKESDIYFSNNNIIFKYNLRNQILTKLAVDGLGSDNFHHMTYDGKKLVYLLTNEGKIFHYDTIDNSTTLILDSKNSRDISEKDKVNRITFADGKFLFATQNGWIYLYNSVSGKLLFNQRYLAHNDEIIALNYDRRLNTIYSSADDGSFCMLEYDEDETFGEKRVDIDFGSNNKITDIKTYKYNGKDYILTSDVNGNLSYWELEISEIFEFIKRKI